MTFEELDSRYPNGFDDAELLGIRIDYVTREARLSLNLRGNSPEDPKRDEYERAELVIYGFYYFSIESPDPSHLFNPETSKIITVDGLPEDPEHFPLFEFLRPKLGTDAFCCRFFVHDWNSFIHLAAKALIFRGLTAAQRRRMLALRRKSASSARGRPFSPQYLCFPQLTALPRG
ncbi:MAG: hypothetical protein WBQ04_07590 [Candidatus Acidiferrales bacterium]